MTVLRAPRDAVFAMLGSLMLVVGLSVGLAVAPAMRVDATDSAVEASSPSTTVADAPTTTVQVASEAPSPGAAVADAPRVGPLDAAVGGTPSRGVWWLFGLGGLQVVGLLVMTRRSRARLSVPDATP
jgi:hypothetical protein